MTIISFFLTNISFSKVIKLNQEISLDVPKSHEYIKIDETSTSTALYGLVEVLDDLSDLDLEVYNPFEILTPDINNYGPTAYVNSYTLPYLNLQLEDGSGFYGLKVHNFGKDISLIEDTSYVLKIIYLVIMLLFYKSAYGVRYTTSVPLVCLVLNSLR